MHRCPWAGRTYLENVACCILTLFQRHLPKAKPLGTWPKVSVVSCPADPLSSPFLSLQVQHNELAS